jgi:ferredoxin
MSYFVVNDNCNGCLSCVQNCPANALECKDNGGKRTLLHNMARCARCANCWRVCPQQAIEFQHFMENQWDNIVVLNLVHCKICGEPIYSVKLENILSEKTGMKVDPVCSKHRESALADKLASQFSRIRKIEAKDDRS